MVSPLSKVWLKLENAQKSDALSISLDEILSFVEQTICFLGPISNLIPYHRRYNILSSVCSPEEAKNMLKNKVELLRTNGENLFGKEFSDHLKQSVKSRKSSKEVFLKPDESKKPFRSGPLLQQQQHNSEGQKQIATSNRGNQRKKKVKVSPTQLFLDASSVIPNAELVTVHLSIKCLFSKGRGRSRINFRVQLNFTKKN